MLIAVVLFSAFAVLAFSGLFDTIESDFYSPRVQRHYRSLLVDSAETVEEYHRHNFERFRSIVEQSAFERVYEVNQSQTDIEGRQSAAERLLSDHPSFSHLRIIDRDGTQIHFSTLSDDFEERDGERIYVPVEDVETDLQDLALPSGGESDLIFDDDAQYFVYRIPVNDAGGVWRGTAMFHVGTRALAGRLASVGLIDSGRDLLLVEGNGYVFNVPRDSRSSVGRAVGSIWSSLEAGQTGRLDANGGIALPFEEEGSRRFAYFLPEHELSLGRELEAVLLAGSFLTLFLVTFLLMNLRQESSVVLSERVRRFQISMLREYLERRDELDWDGKARELQRLKPELTKKIKRGIGKVRPDERERLDELVEKGWDEILEVIGGRRASGTANLDVKHLESMLERVVSSLGDRIPHALPDTGSAAPDSEQSAGLHPVNASSKRTGTAVVAPGIAGSDTGTQSSRGEATEDLESLESADEDGGLEEIEEVEEVEEADEVEELDSLEAVEDVGGAEDVEEPGEVEELESLEPADEDASAEGVEVADETEEVEELDSIEAADGGNNSDAGEPEYPGNSIRQGGNSSGVQDPRRNADAAGAFMNVSIEDEIEAIADEGHPVTGSTVPADAAAGAANGSERDSENESENAPSIHHGEIVSMSSVRRIFGEGAIVSSGSGVFQIDEALFSSVPKDMTETSSVESASGTAASFAGESGRSQDSLFLGEVSMRPVSRSSRRHHATAPGRGPSGKSAESRGRPDDRKSVTPGGSRATAVPERDRVTAGGKSANEPDGLLRPDGIDFDRFLRRYRNNDAGIVRALVFFTRRVGAPVALIMVPRSDGYRGQYSLGLDEGIAKRIHVLEESEFARSVLDKRMVFHHEAPLHTLPGLEIESHGSMLSSFKRSLFIPIQFRQSNGYLVLGLPLDGQPAEAVLEQVRDTIISS